MKNGGFFQGDHSGPYSPKAFVVGKASGTIQERLIWNKQGHRNVGSGLPGVLCYMHQAPPCRTSQARGTSQSGIADDFDHSSPFRYESFGIRPNLKQGCKLIGSVGDAFLENLVRIPDLDYQVIFPSSCTSPKPLPLGGGNHLESARET